MCLDMHSLVKLTRENKLTIVSLIKTFSSCAASFHVLSCRIAGYLSFTLRHVAPNTDHRDLSKQNILGLP